MVRLKDGIPLACMAFVHGVVQNASRLSRYVCLDVVCVMLGSSPNGI